MFRALANNVDDPNTIPDYLEKFMARKEADRKKNKMMGTDVDTLKNKIDRFESDTSADHKEIDVEGFKK